MESARVVLLIAILFSHIFGMGNLFVYLIQLAYTVINKTLTLLDLVRGSLTINLAVLLELIKKLIW